MPSESNPERTPDPLTALADVLSAAVVVVGSDGAVAAWDERAAEWFGIPAERALGHPPRQAGLPGADAWEPLLEAAREHGRAGRTRALEVPGDPERWVEVAVLPRPGAGAALVAVDVSERVRSGLRAARLEQRAVWLEAVALRRERFFSAMSHDLRTPITAIVGYSELLQDGIVGELDGAQREMVERISQVAGQLSHLVNDILDLAKLDAGRMELHLEDARLGEMLDEAVLAVTPQARSKSLALRLEVDGFREEVLRVDAPRVRQILVNLLSNAVKFTDRGEVAVRVGTDGEGRSWIEVRDTGPGLPAGSEEAVFEEFLQIAAGTHAKREPGSGLGLAIARRLARAMGGDLVARTGPGGAAFTLFLPTRGDG